RKRFQGGSLRRDGSPSPSHRRTKRRSPAMSARDCLRRAASGRDRQERRSARRMRLTSRSEFFSAYRPFPIVTARAPSPYAPSSYLTKARNAATPMTTLLFEHDAFGEHETPPGHPERAERYYAASKALKTEPFDGLVRREAPRASRDAL